MQINGNRIRERFKYMNKLQELTLEGAIRECIGAGPVDPVSYRDTLEGDLSDTTKIESLIIGLQDGDRDAVYYNLLACVEALELEELFLSKIASGVVTVETPPYYRRELLLELNGDDYIKMLFKDIEIKQAISEGAKEVTVVEPCRDWFELCLNEVYVKTLPPLMDGTGDLRRNSGISLAVIMSYKGGCTLTGEQMYKQIDFIRERFVAGKYHLKLETPEGNNKLTILIDRKSISQFIAEAREKVR